ncbi:MAG TPA: hypothetical protein DCQ35_00630, partial [Rhodospirillum rubrum]|nr:hypothetical protein [Rhodospirillum rubrum]
MLIIPPHDRIDDITIYKDSDDPWMFYAIANIPRLRLGPDGKPVFTFLKYAEVDPGPDGKGVSGGYVQFDTAFGLTSDQAARVRGVLQERADKAARDQGLPNQPVRLGDPTWTEGSIALVTFQEGTGIVDKVMGGGTPSLLGDNIAVSALQLSEAGAQLFWAACQMPTMPIGIVMKMKFLARIPSIEMHVWLQSENFASYYEKIDRDEPFWGDDTVTQTRREDFRRTNSGDVNVVRWPDFSADPSSEKKFKDEIVEWGWSLLQDHFKAALADVIPPFTERGEIDGIEHVERSLIVSKVSDLDVYFKQDSIIPWSINPQATLQSALAAGGGRFPKEDFFKEIPLNDAFFKRLSVKVDCNASWSEGIIHSVVVTLRYADKIESFTFQKDEDTFFFRRLIDPALGRTYRYDAVIHFKASTRTLTIPETETDKAALVIPVSRLAGLAVTVLAGDIDWEKTVQQVQVALSYEDAANGVAERTTTLLLAADSKSQVWKEQILAAVTKPYRYTPTYVLKSGRTLARPTAQSTNDTLIINDVFGERINLTFVPAGSFTRMAGIFVEVDYQDAANDHRVKQTVQLLSEKDSPVVSIPRWDNGPTKFRYRFRVSYKDGRLQEVDWKDGDGSSSLAVGELFEETVEITIKADLLDWSLLRFVLCKLDYSDDAANYRVRDDFVFTPTQSADKLLSLI